MRESKGERGVRYLVLVLGTGITVLGALLGARLLHKGWRLRGLPELALGTYFFLPCVLGFLPDLVATAIRILDPDGVRFQLQVIGQGEGAAFYFQRIMGPLGFELAPGALALFTWRTFRPRSKVAALFAGGLLLLGLVMMIRMVLQAIGEDLRPRDAMAFARILAMHLPPIVWTSFESLRHYRPARRRVGLGLADRVVVNRILLWGLAMASLVALVVVRVVGYALADPPTSSTAIALSFLAMGSGLFAVASIWLALYPPASYLRWLGSPAVAGRQAA